MLDGGEYLDRLADQWLKPIYQQGKQAMEATRDLAEWPEEDRKATEQLAAHGMTIREIDRSGLQVKAERFWIEEARTLGVTPWLETVRR